MPFEDTIIILEFHQYPDLECLIEKIDVCKNNPENSFRQK